MPPSSKSTRKPKVSDSVHFVPTDAGEIAMFGRCRAGIVVAVHRNHPENSPDFEDVERLQTVNLTWFDRTGNLKTNTTAQAFEHSAEGHKRTWHWPDECLQES